MDDTHFGFYIDAVDSQKFGIPTTASQAKCLAKMKRIKQKLTGVQLFRDDSLLLFRTLPDVKTGGNLTLTILGHMLQNFVRDTNVADLYINFDGASDNICYTVLYGIAHYLRCARANGWALRRVHCLRFIVGHTHNILDSTFGVLSRHVYGKHGTTPRDTDLLSFWFRCCVQRGVPGTTATNCGHPSGPRFQHVPQRLPEKSRRPPYTQAVCLYFRSQRKQHGFCPVQSPLRR